MSDTVAQRGIRPGLCSQIELPDGRTLDVWQAGPPDGEPLVFHHGTPGSGLPFDLDSGWRSTSRLPVRSCSTIRVT